VTTADGRDVATELVREGLARAFGICRATPDGRTAEDYRDALRDLELQAAKRGAGAWARTDWDKLPDERRAQRAEEAELKSAIGKSKPAAGFTLDPNTATREELTKLPRVGDKTAERIIAGRPYKKLEELERAGIAKKLLEELRPYLKIAGDR
jgi:DNA uptake protein ComE-like DNA-binding protein